MLGRPVDDGDENARAILLILVGRSVGIVRTHFVDLADLRLIANLQGAGTRRPGIGLTEIDRSGKTRVIEIAGEHIPRGKHEAHHHLRGKNRRPGLRFILPAKRRKEFRGSVLVVLFEESIVAAVPKLYAFGIGISNRILTVTGIEPDSLRPARHVAVGNLIPGRRSELLAGEGLSVLCDTHFVSRSGKNTRTGLNAVNVQLGIVLRRGPDGSEAVLRAFDEHGVGPVGGALYAILHAAAFGNIRSRNGRGIGPQIGIVVIGQSRLARQMAGQGFGRALTLRISHLQDELMIRSFIVNLRDHRNKRRNIERQRRFARNGIPGREPERAERFGHAAGIHEVQLGRQAYRSEHFGRQSRRVDRNRKALNSTGSRYRHLDRHRSRDLLRLVDVTAIQCNGRSCGQVTCERFGRTLSFRIGHFQDELVVRSFVIDLRNHRNKRRNIERQRRFA